VTLSLLFTLATPTISQIITSPPRNTHRTKQSFARTAKLLAAVPLALVIPLQAWSRVGETLDECTIRYGPVQRLGPSEATRLTDSKLYAFNKSGLRILTELKAGKVAIISFSRERITILRKPAPLTEEQILTLLRSNGPDAKWRRLATSAVLSRWEDAKGGLHAEYPVDEATLTIFSATALQELSLGTTTSGQPMDLSDF